MKQSILKTMFALVLGLTGFTTLFAQESTHLRTLELDSFDEIRVSMDTEVILIKSSRNQLTLVGDSSYILNFPVSTTSDILSFSYAEEEDMLLTRVVIEYTDLDKVITGGSGNYYFHKLNEDDLEIYNPFANVTIDGRINNIRIYSEDGDTDVTKLTADKMVLHMGDTATLLKRNNGKLYSSRRDQ